MGRQGVGCVAFTPDGTRLVAGTSGDATLFIWRIDDGRLLRKIPGTHGTPLAESINPWLNCVAVTPDSRQIMSVGQTTRPLADTKVQGRHIQVMIGEVRFWDIANGDRVADYHHEKDYGFGYGALSSDGRRVALADFGRLRILDAATGRTVHAIELPGSWGRRPAFSPDGRIVAMPIANAISLFDVSSGRRLHHDASTPVGNVVSAAWSPSGDRLVSGQFDGLVRVWDSLTGKLIWHKELAPHNRRNGRNARVTSVSFSSDAQLLVAAGVRDDPATNDLGIITLYDTASGRSVREIPQKQISSPAMSPDGRIVVVATSQGRYVDTHFLEIEVAMWQTR
jgi:WD40 repeat protein